MSWSKQRLTGYCKHMIGLTYDFVGFVIHVSTICYFGQKTAVQNSLITNLHIIMTDYKTTTLITSRRLIINELEIIKMFKSELCALGHRDLVIVTAELIVTTSNLKLKLLICWNRSLVYFQRTMDLGNYPGPTLGSWLRNLLQTRRALQILFDARGHKFVLAQTRAVLMQLNLLKCFQNFPRVYWDDNFKDHF